MFFGERVNISFSSSFNLYQSEVLWFGKELKADQKNKLPDKLSEVFIQTKQRTRNIFNPSSPKRQTLDSSKLKEFADDNSKFDKNDIKFSKRVENTVGKGEIAHNEQFLLFPQCFQNTCTVIASDTCDSKGLYGKGLEKKTA